MIQHSSPIIEANKHNKGRSASRDVDVDQGHFRRDSRRRSWWHNIYQRVSQSGEEDEKDDHLSLHPKRKSASRPKNSAHALPLIRETPGYLYEDPPPLSTLDAFHLSRFADTVREIPRNKPTHTSPPVPNFAYQPPEPMKLNANSRVQLGRSDSLLGRVFTYIESDAHVTNTDLDHGTESQPSRPTSLWRAGSANVIPKHNEERSSVTQVNISDGVYVFPQPVNPVSGDVVGVNGVPSQDVEPPTPPPKRSHIREMAGHSVSPPDSPIQPSSPVIGDLPVGDDPLTNSLQLHQSPGAPKTSAGYDHSLPLPIPEQVEPVYLRTTYPLPMPDPQSRSSQQYPIADLSSPPDTARPYPTTRHKVLLRPFPEPVNYPSPNMGPIRFSPPRSTLTPPTPLAQPLPCGNGSLRRNKMNSLPPPEQFNLAGGGAYREPPSRPRRHSQPITAPRHTIDPDCMPHPPNPSPRKPHHRTPHPLSTHQEASHSNISPPSGPPHRPTRRLSSPPLSALPPDRPSRSNAIHRKFQPLESRSPTRFTSRRASLLAELRSAPPLDCASFTRYHAPGPGSGIGSPPRDSRTRASPSPRTPTFVNTHMLPPSTNSPRSGVEEWASAVSSFSPSVRTNGP